MANELPVSTSPASTLSQPGGSGKPRTRQRVYKAPPPLEVPDIDQDAAERKRVLNVLAQRRYRERKRLDRLKSNGGKAAKNTLQGTPSHESDSSCHERPEGCEATAAGICQPSPAPSGPSSVDSGANFMDMDLINWSSIDSTDLSSFLPGATEPQHDFLGGQATADGNFSLPEFSWPSVVQTVPSQLESPASFESGPSATSSDHDFPDSYLLPVHELTLLKAMIRICKRIGCDREDLWALDCPSPFNTGSATPSDQLPDAWRPTPLQVSVKHHPVIDLLPWPAVRNRLLAILTLPDSARPPNAQGGRLAIVNLVYDLEDSAEGVRIYGAQPCDPGSWEVGQVLFERWWFLFDRDIIATSNRWRQLRGAPALMLQEE